MGSYRAIATVVACSLVTTPTASVVAQPTAGEAQARELVAKASDHSKAGDHKAAIDLYLQAFNIAPNAILLSNVASEYEKLNDPADALKYFCKYIDADPEGPMASYALSHAKEQQGKLHNAVDDQTVCKPRSEAGSGTPATDGGGSAVSSGSAPGAGGGALVAPGNQQVGSPPVVVEETPGHGERLVGLGAAAVGVVGLGLGIVFGIKAQDAANSITDHNKGSAWPDDIKTIESDGQRDQTLQITFLIAGGVLVAGGAVVYYLGHEQGKTPSEHASLRPVVTPGYAGLVYGGGF